MSVEQELKTKFVNDQSVSTKVNIGDILRLALPLDSTVIADAAHMRRNVHWVAVLITWSDLHEQVHAGDLVIIPPDLHRQLTDSQLAEKFKVLAKLTVLGLLFFREISDELSDLANRLGLPLLIAPPDAPFRDIHRAIASLLIDRMAATAERGMQLYRRLSEMSREEQGLEAMTDVMGNLTGKIVIIQDKRLEVQAISVPRNNKWDIDTITTALSRREQLPAVLRNRKAAARAHQSYWQQLLPIADLARVISPIVSGDRARGYLSVIGLVDEIDLLDSLTVEHGAAACALEMAKAKAVSEAKKSLRGDFLEGLLAGTMPQKEIVRLESRLDHDTTPPHAVMTFSWALGPEVPSVRRLETAVSWVLSNHSRSALVHVYSDQYVCIFQALKDESDMDSAHQLVKRLHQQVESEFPKARLNGGISGPALKLAEWPAVYAEALQAMQLGERLQLNHTVEFHSLGVYRLLGQLEDIPIVQTFTDQVIGPLAQYDQQRNSNLVKTIAAYFNHHGNISQTAESLFIHRNTLLYRLERIQELTGQDLDQSNMRLALHLALKLWQLRPGTGAK